jgi:hypothetical protein
VKERSKFITAAALVNEESVARFMRVRAQMMALYQRDSKTGGSFVDVDRTPFFETKQRVLMGHFPLDHIAMTSASANKLAAFDASIKSCRVLAEKNCGSVER